MKFAVATLGCKVNSYESEGVIQMFKAQGFEFCSFDDVCDVYIINTCTVTKTADQKCRQILSQARRKNSNAVICAMGCYAQLNALKVSEYADVVVGNNNKSKVYELVKSYLDTKQQIVSICDILNKPSYDEIKVSMYETHTRGFVKIQDGCENYCSYCAIPYSRGNIRSRKPENVIAEIESLISNGTNEVILSGINTGTYGQDLENMSLAKLISMILEKTTLPRIRLSSIELMEITDELLNTLVKYQNRVCNHLHIPLQGGSDEVLKRMHRKYLTKDYAKRIKDIRKLFPSIALTTDILAGFVGETEEEFKETLSFIQEIGFYEMHVFPYSRRAGTEADKMSGHLENALKQQRAREIIKVAKVMEEDYIKKFIGTTLSVLVETTKDGYYHGHTSNYLDVYFTSELDLVNKFVLVTLCEYRDGKIYGKLKEENDE